MPRNVYNSDETAEQRRQQNERVKHLLEKWMNAPAWNCDLTAIEAELDNTNVIVAAQAKLVSGTVGKSMFVNCGDSVQSSGSPSC